MLGNVLPQSPAVELSNLRRMLASFDMRAWALVALSAVVIAFVIALAAAFFDNPIFGRTEPVRAQDYVFLAVAALLGGLIAGSYALPSAAGDEGKAMTGGFLSFVAVGCPACNKAAVLALGTSGALSIFGPLQLYIGFSSVLLLLWTLSLRARAVVGSCSVA